MICADNRSRKISGISAFTDPSEWVDIQFLTSGEDRMITIRRYRQGDESQDTSAVRSRRHFARVAAGANFSADEIIELTDKVAPEVLEAALMEIRKPFEINSKVLLRLSKAGVSPQVTKRLFRDERRHACAPIPFARSYTCKFHTNQPRGAETSESGHLEAAVEPHPCRERKACSTNAEKCFPGGE